MSTFRYPATTIFQTMQQYEVHELSAIFPDLNKEDRKQLHGDIAANGQLDPVTLYQGKILDGKNRYVICQELGIECKTIKLAHGIDPIRFVISKNLIRRHLDENERAFIAAQLAEMTAGRNWESNSALGPNKKISQAEAARMMKVSERRVKRAKRVLTQGGPELKRAIDNKEISLKAADGKIREKVRTAKNNNGSKDHKTPLQRQREALDNAPGLMNGKGLTREQVDPELADKPFEFASKYGFVNLHTKEQVETDKDKAAFSQWIGAIKRLKAPLKELLKIGSFNQSNVESWIKRASDPSKFPARYAEIYEMVSVIKQAGDSVTGLLEWLNTHKSE